MYKKPIYIKVYIAADNILYIFHTPTITKTLKLWIKSFYGEIIHLGHTLELKAKHFCNQRQSSEEFVQRPQRQPVVCLCKKSGWHCCLFQQNWDPINQCCTTSSWFWKLNVASIPSTVQTSLSRSNAWTAPVLSLKVRSARRYLCLWKQLASNGWKVWGKCAFSQSKDC